jgi:hypothetical protein
MNFRAGIGVLEKKNYFTPAGIGTPDPLSCNLVAVLTALSRLQRMDF